MALRIACDVAERKPSAPIILMYAQEMVVMRLEPKGPEETGPPLRVGSGMTGCDGRKGARCFWRVSLGTT